MKRFSDFFIKDICLPALLVLMVFSTKVHANLPNVVFVLADDIGPGDINYYRTGSVKEVVPTPNLDFIASNGIWFTDANTPAAVCAPTRYSILTGNNSYRCRLPLGVWSPFDSLGAIAKNEQTVANVMQEAGYKTAFLGKWHLGGKWEKVKQINTYKGSEIWDDDWDYSQQTGHYPNVLGFDYSLSLPNGIQGIPYAFYENGKWMPLTPKSEIVIWNKPSWNPYPDGDILKSKGDSEWDETSVGSILANKASNFIINHVKKHKGKPFFMYYCSQAVHLPHEPPEYFNGIKVRGATPTKHADMIVELDLQMGLLIDALKKADVYNNTLFIFTSDNGALFVKETIQKCHDSSAGYNGFKGSIFEGGTRVPFIVMWPKVVEKKRVCDEPIMAHDLMATLYALTGINMPYEQAMDSYNLLPLIKNELGAKGRETKMYQSGSPWSKSPTNKMLAYREGHWKLIMYSDENCNIGEPYALFNLKENSKELESENLLSKDGHKERAKQMLARYRNLRNSGKRTTILVDHK